MALKARAAFDGWALGVAGRIDRWAPGWWWAGRRELALARFARVPQFARWFWNGGSRRPGSFLRRLEGGRSSRLVELDRFTRVIEAKHLTGVIVCTAVPAAAFLLGHSLLGVELSLLNVVGHGYPILSMRWVRSRVARLEKSATPLPTHRHTELTAAQ
jgi:hypothetical protein